MIKIDVIIDIPKTCKHCGTTIGYREHIENSNRCDKCYEKATNLIEDAIIDNEQ